MEPSCVRHTQIPGTSALFTDYLYDYGKVSKYFPRWFGDESALQASAAALEFPTVRRRALVDALRQQNGDSQSLDLLAKDGTVAVVTGQQVGLFSGPAYTIFKALTAARLAQHLSDNGTPAVPIFWLATEDHDLAEVDHAWLFDAHANPKRVSFEPEIAGGGPVGDVVLKSVPIEELRSALSGLLFADKVVERVSAAYQPGKTLGVAFRELLQSVLDGFGLLFLDPLAPAFRELGAPFLSQAASQITELLSALEERSRELERDGYHAQVNIEPDSSLLFAIQNGKRLPIRFKEGKFFVRGGRSGAVRAEELSRRLSPNALLRPVMQDYLLPTVAYVGGPAEIAYMAQAEVLYKRLLGRMPVIYPRNGFTLLDQDAQNLLEDYRLHVPELLDHSDRVRSRFAERLVPTELRDRLGRMRETVADELAATESALIDFDPTLAAAAAKSRVKMLYQAEKIATKTAREALRRNSQASADADYLINLIYPEKHLQERFYSIVPFLAKFGMDLPRQLAEHTQLSCPDHMVRICQVAQTSSSHAADFRQFTGSQPA